jgi:hypothetical protein
MGDYVGMVDLEGTLLASILVVDTSDTPINADAAPTYRVYGPNGFVENGATSFRDSGTITGATNQSPIVITSANHQLTTGARVTITGVVGNEAANGTFVVTTASASTFSLNGSAGDGPYDSGGTWNVTGLYGFTIVAQGVSGYEKGENYEANFVYAISSVQKGQLAHFQVA